MTDGLSLKFAALADPTRRDMSAWMEQYRIFWEASFDRLDDYLTTVTAAQNPQEKAHGHKKPLE
jgi:hypothetical protein